jgi:hypothetical protein
VSDSELEPLGIPGQSIAPRGRLARWLLGTAGVFLLGVMLVAIPRPRAIRKEEGLTLIETIGLADDRQLVILRKKHYALVLGVTRSATHLLEKVSMASLDSDYHTVINAIIKRESESPELWRMRPLFSGSYRTEYAPEERAAPARRSSLGELRASLQVVGPARASVTTAQPATMTELRSRGSKGKHVQRAKPVQSDRDAVMRRLQERARRAS